jgi:hypothetical protein
MAIPGFLHVAGSLPVSTTIVRKFAAGDLGVAQTSTFTTMRRARRLRASFERAL